MEEPIPLEVLEDDSADFLAAEATVVNAVSPHMSVTNRGGTPKVQRVTIQDIDGAKYVDITDGAKGDTGLQGIQGIKGDTGDDAGFGNLTASVDNGVGTPNVEVSSSGPNTAKNFNFDFTNLKGDTGPQGIQGIQGIKGDTGDDAGFGNLTASVDNGVGTPNVEVSSSGPNTAKNFNFDFTNLKGDTGPIGETGDPAGFGTITASMDPNNIGPGTPEVVIVATGPDSAKNIALTFKNLKGESGDGAFNPAFQSKLEGIEAGAEVNVQSNWNETDSSSDSYIQNKPSIPTKTSDITNDSGFLTYSNNLDATKLTGIVPSANLPSYVDDVLEYASVSQFPVTGESGKIYIDVSDNNTYRWTGTIYASISNPLDYATQAEAESGIENTKVMTPLRTRQSLPSYAMTIQEVDDAVALGLNGTTGDTGTTGSSGGE